MEEIEEPKKTPDSRRYLREPIIVFKVVEEVNHQYFFGYAKNISRGGFFIASINPKEPGERFYITFQIPKTEIKARCQCEVVWTRKYSKDSKVEPGYGVRFLDLSQEIADSIDQWIKADSQGTTL